MQPSPSLPESHPLEGRKIALVRDDRSAVGSANTRMIEAALACGYKKACDEWFTDLIEQTPTGPKRQVTWLIAGDVPAEFLLPNGRTETLAFGDFRARWKDLEWCRANPDHPIAYLRFASDIGAQLRRQLKSMTPAVIMRNGNRSAVIPANATPEEIAEAKAHIGI